ncbi:hypothetical protein [Anaerostipes sp.]|uniref:hypothetical protein n=1 Tax=Anaerostipes sp. TaxID=1872530 RepID=UPI00352784AD
MSLGIYDAFIFDQSYTMEELTKMVDILRKDVKKPIDIPITQICAGKMSILLLFERKSQH